MIITLLRRFKWRPDAFAIAYVQRMPGSEYLCSNICHVHVLFNIVNLQTMVEYSCSGFNIEHVQLALVSQPHIPFYGTLYSRVRIWKSTLACANECAPRAVKGPYVVCLYGKYETGFSISHLLKHHINQGWVLLAYGDSHWRAISDVHWQKLQILVI